MKPILLPLCKLLPLFLVTERGAALGLWAYISGKSLVPMLQLYIYIYIYINSMCYW